MKHMYIVALSCLKGKALYKYYYYIKKECILLELSHVLNVPHFLSKITNYYQYTGNISVTCRDHLKNSTFIFFKFNHYFVRFISCIYTAGIMLILLITV